MEAPILLAIAAVVVLVLLRHLAARRVAAGQGQFVWVMFVPAFLGGFVTVWAAVQVFATSPVIGVGMALAGVFYLAVLARLMSRLSGAVASTSSGGDPSTAMTDAVADYMLTIMGVTLVGGVIALTGLVVWGLIQAAD